VLAEWREVVIPFDDLNQQQAIGIVDVWSCIKLLADTAASCALIAYCRVGEQGRPRLTSGRLVELLARPAPASTQPTMFSTAVAHLALYGNAYLGKFVDAEGRDRADRAAAPGSGHGRTRGRPTSLPGRRARTASSPSTHRRRRAHEEPQLGRARRAVTDPPLPRVAGARVGAHHAKAFFDTPKALSRHDSATSL
jgi:hypothetical protein